MVGSDEKSGEDPRQGTGTTLEIAREKPCATWNVDGGSACSPSVRTLGEGETVIIGSGRSAGVRVFDRSVSACHCVLNVEGGELAIRDLGSKNGLFVGGARVESARLGPGSTFVLGRVVMSCTQSVR